MKILYRSKQVKVLLIILILFYSCGFYEIKVNEERIESIKNNKMPPSSKIIEVLGNDWFIIDFRNTYYLFYLGCYDSMVLVEIEYIKELNK